MTPSATARARPAVPRALDQRVDDSGEPDGEQRAPDDVEVRARVLVARLGHVPHRDPRSRRPTIGRLMRNTHRHETESMR